MTEINEFERILGREFRNKELATEALTHSSLLNESKGRVANARLAFLGDAVLELAVRAALFERLKESDRHQLTLDKIGLVSNKALADLKASQELAKFLEPGKSRPMSKRVLAEVFEAAIGAVFIDSKNDFARRPTS